MNNKKFTQRFENSLEISYCLNEKGDRLLVCTLKDGYYVVQAYKPSFKSKKLIKAEEIKIKSDSFEMAPWSIELIFKPLYKDFLIYIKKRKE